MELVQNKTILIVDDDPCSLFLCEAILRPFYKTKTVSNGYDAIKLSEENNYDAILMDINLADMNMDGIRTMKMIRKNSLYRNSKIFAITSFSTNRQWFLNVGFDDLFLKPLSEETIMMKIKNKLSRYPILDEKN